VHKQERLSVLRLDFQFHHCLAPNVLSVQHVYFLTGFYTRYLVLFNPLLVVFYTFFPPLGVLVLASQLFTFNHELNRVVYQLWLLKNQLSDIFAALGALALSQQRFVDAFFTETVTTYCGSTADNEVHTYAALDAVYGAHWLEKTVAKLAWVVLFLLLDTRYFVWLTLCSHFSVPSPRFLRNGRNFFLIGSSKHWCEKSFEHD
jgi:hypothetical protein